MSLIDWLFAIGGVIFCILGLWVVAFGLIMHFAGRINTLRDEYTLEKYDP